MWQVGDLYSPLAPPPQADFYTWLSWANEYSKLLSQFHAIYKAEEAEAPEPTGAAEAPEATGTTAGPADAAALERCQSLSTAAGAAVAAAAVAHSQNSQSQVAKLQPVASCTVLHRFPIPDCDIWFVKMSLNQRHRLLAVGNRDGLVTLWQLGAEGRRGAGGGGEGRQNEEERCSNWPSRCVQLKRCLPVTARRGGLPIAIAEETVVRQIAIDEDARIVIAVYDNATVVRWDRLHL